MRSLFILSALIGFAFANDAFIKFAKDFGKKYTETKEFNLRREIFLNNYQEMLEHNARYEAGEVSWSRKVTEFYDLTYDEFVVARGLGMPQYDETTKFEDIEDPAYMEQLEKIKGTAPAEWSWVAQGGVTSVKNQKQCGSCAAFATIAVIDTCYWQATGNMYDDLSEQHLVDCAAGHYFYDNDGAWGAFGCDGAWPPAYFDWLVNNNGGRTQTESSYPYEASDHHCRGSSSGNYNGAHVTGQYNKWDTTEEAMKDLVYLNPVTTTILATYLGDYDQGIYDDNRCCDQATDSSCKYNLNHEITVVGYGTEHGKDYWLIKNSWGTRFGENGYFKIKRGTGHCGVGRLHYNSAYCAPN
eukprot:TRINITY_DN1348_c0_g1_i1.p1 TRINITY_DN1348_c0_g1~~TRINITY_DN1348_c0_g1_i1.p1  ORF type:complete len:355 (+),score=118.11 TRINITY_DN1348_c0_g1_i1:102-1166(+)